MRLVGAFLGGLKGIKSFLSTVIEWHVFVVGLGDGIGFQSTGWWGKGEKELHYYKAGVGIGRFGVFFWIAFLAKWVIGG